MNPLVVVRQSSIVGAGETRRVGASAWWWCPGCEQARGFGAHRFAIVGDDGSTPDGSCWTFDGNLDAPTFDPSYLTWLGEQASPWYRCHTFVRAGRIEYLGDCSHPLVGQTVEMVPVPDWLAG